MNNDRFGVSIKGVLEHNERLLLRKNERLEYELLGGRLEKGDPSAEMRLETEFVEESGIRIKVLRQTEPWLYEIGFSNIIIVPFMCQALEIPDVLVDEDGGTLHWITKKSINGLFLPQGYKDSIHEDIPHKCYSIPAKKYFKVIPNYVERNYFVELRATENGKDLFALPLPHHIAPRDLLFRELGESYKDAIALAQPIGIDYERDTITLNYDIGLQ